MMTRNGPLMTMILATAALATTAIGHEDVADPTVKARMELMGEIKAATGTLAGMAQGKTAFDPAAAADARRALEAHASEIPAAFRDRATDPESEARPTIWEDFADFTAKAKMLEESAAALGTTSPDELKAGIGDVGRSCSGCHEVYRLKD